MIFLAGPSKRVNACSPKAATRKGSEPVARTVAARVCLLSRASSVSSVSACRLPYSSNQERNSEGSPLSDSDECIENVIVMDKDQKLTSKVISLLVLLNHDLLPILILDSYSRPSFDKVKLITGLTFPDDILTLRERARLEDVGYLGSFLGLKRCEDGHFGEEGFVQAAFARGVLCGGKVLAGAEGGIESIKVCEQRWKSMPESDGGNVSKPAE